MSGVGISGALPWRVGSGSDFYRRSVFIRLGSVANMADPCVCHAETAELAQRIVDDHNAAIEIPASTHYCGVQSYHVAHRYRGTDGEIRHCDGMLRRDWYGTPVDEAGMPLWLDRFDAIVARLEATIRAK